MNTAKRTFGSEIGKTGKVYPSDKQFDDHLMSVEKIRIAHSQHETDNDRAACAFKLMVSVLLHIQVTIKLISNA